MTRFRVELCDGQPLAQCESCLRYVLRYDGVLPQARIKPMVRHGSCLDWRPEPRPVRVEDERP